MCQSKSETNREARAETNQIEADQKKRAKCGYSNNLLYKGDFIRCYCKHPDGVTNMAIFGDFCPKSRYKEKREAFKELTRVTRMAHNQE